MKGRETAEQITGSATKADLWQLLGVVIKNTECFSLITAFSTTWHEILL
jgi:hypothetical protein